MHFEIFRSIQAYAFQLLSDNNQPLLTSRTYPDLAACTEGIRIFVRQAASQANVSTSVDNGSYVYTVQADGIELARSIPYTTADSATTAATELTAYIATTADYEVTFTDVTTQSIQRPGFSIDLDSYDFLQVSKSGRLGFEAFQSSKNNLYYFHFNDTSGRAILHSQAYASESMCSNGIRSVIQNISHKERCETRDEKGNFYFILKAANGREVARSRFFASASERDQAIEIVRIHAITFAEQYKKPEKARIRNGNPPTDKYNFAWLSQSEQSGFESFQQPLNKQHYFHFNNQAGKAILYSQGYTNTTGRDNGIRSVIKNAYIDSRCIRAEEGGMHYFILKSGNNQEIARSPLFASVTEMDAAIAYLKSKSVTYANQYKVEMQTEELQNTETQRFNIHIDRPEPVVVPVVNRTIDQYDFTQKSPLGLKGFETFFSERNQAYYFHFNDEDGNPILFSESYPNAQVRDNGLKSVKKNALLNTQWKVLQENDKYFYCLRAGNNQEIARGPMYNTKGLALAKLSFIQSNKAGATAALAASVVAVLPDQNPAIDEPLVKENVTSAEPVQLVDIPAPVKQIKSEPALQNETAGPATIPVAEPIMAPAVTETTTSGYTGWILGGVAAAVIIVGSLWWFNRQSAAVTPESMVSAIQANTADPVTDATIVAAETIENFQPIALYFDNDHPNPRTQTPTTPLSYDATFADYYQQKGVFEREYSNGTADATKARQEIDDFFTEKVKKGYDELMHLSGKLLDKLKAGNKIEITLTGFASPLATGEYNKLLTGRRISSIENHFRTYNNGQFKEYIDKGMLVITEQASGEDHASQTISDDRTNTRISWYSPAASEERRVEITNVTVSKAP